MSATLQFYTETRVAAILWRGFTLKASEEERGAGPDYCHEGDEIGIWVSKERDGSWSATLEVGPLMVEEIGGTACDALEGCRDNLWSELEHTKQLLEKCFAAERAE